MNDALGLPIIVGDQVAYVSRQGSRICIEQRRVEQVMEHSLMLNGTVKRFVNPKNVIVLVRPIA